MAREAIKTQGRVDHAEHKARYGKISKFRDKKFKDLTPAEKDQLLEAVAMRLHLVKEKDA